MQTLLVVPEVSATAGHVAHRHHLILCDGRGEELDGFGHVALLHVRLAHYTRKRQQSFVSFMLKAPVCRNPVYPPHLGCNTSWNARVGGEAGEGDVHVPWRTAGGWAHC